MRAVAKDPNGKWQLTASRYGIQTVEEIARKVFGPKYTKKDLETIKKLRQEEINRLAEIRTKTLQGESIIASITDKSSMGVLVESKNKVDTPISNINNSNFKNGTFYAYTSLINEPGVYKEGRTYFDSKDDVPIEIDRKVLTTEEIEMLANMIAMPLELNGRKLSNQEKYDYLTSVYLGSQSTISFYPVSLKSGKDIDFKVNNILIENYASPEAARDEAIRLLTEKSNVKTPKGNGRLNINQEMLRNNKKITLYEFVDGVLTAKSIDYQNYIRDNFVARVELNEEKNIKLFNAYFRYSLINAESNSSDITSQDRNVTPTTVEDSDAALEPLYEKEFIIDENNNNNYVEINAEEKVIQGTERVRQSVIKNRLKPYDGPKVNDNKGAIRGIIIDELFRAFMAGEISTIEEMKENFEELQKEYKISKLDKEGQIIKNTEKDIKFHETLFETLTTIFTNLKKKLGNDYEIYPDLPTLWGELGGEKVAAKIDLLLYSRIIQTKNRNNSKSIRYNSN